MREKKVMISLPTTGEKGTTGAGGNSQAALKNWVKTTTGDNGKEFTNHAEISKALDCNAYFAKPYHSWERGQNENANGLLRQYFPKSMELIDIPVSAVCAEVDKLNNRPRKCLGFRTPYEVFENLAGINIKKLCTYDLNSGDFKYKVEQKEAKSICAEQIEELLGAVGKQRTEVIDALGATTGKTVLWQKRLFAAERDSVILKLLLSTGGYVSLRLLTYSTVI